MKSLLVTILITVSLGGVVDAAAWSYSSARPTVAPMPRRRVERAL
jgi:hypothetical protein